jgi:hypothetical protein
MLQGNNPPPYYDSMIILKNPNDDWHDKVQYCIDHNIPHKVTRIKHYDHPIDSVVTEYKSKSNTFIRRWFVMFPNGVLLGCNKSKRNDANCIQNMVEPFPKIPCCFCLPVANFEENFSDEQKAFLRERRDNHILQFGRSKYV